MTVKHIFLVGPMGVGKSTIGRLLATELSFPFFDSDRVIEQRTGADIPWIFDVEGEAGFRQRETGVLVDLVHGSPAVISTGGGIVMTPENCELMQHGGFVCYLTASVDQLVERTARDKKRPLLQVDDPKARIVELLNIRAPLYSTIAHCTVNTDHFTPKHVVSEIIKKYNA